MLVEPMETLMLEKFCYSTIPYIYVENTFSLQDDDNNFDDTDYDSDAADSVKTSLTINIGKSD